MIDRGRSRIDAAAGAKYSWTANLSRGYGIPLEQNPIERIAEIANGRDPMRDEQFAQEITVVYVIIDQAGKHSLASGIDDDRFFGHLDSGPGNDLADTVFFDHDRGVIDGFAAVAVEKSAALDD
jgi:hypothetical protein